MTPAPGPGETALANAALPSPDPCGTVPVTALANAALPTGLNLGNPPTALANAALPGGVPMVPF